ncbi:diaminopimelate decarboxylase [Parasulfuritortus cantonensis]|uniref:Diaminopimelate decarboxylase n=1 Tax=Parasulfuritortus cantonensis TaxID=2528202 RepID=A0A4R1B3A3_9PROT|nr:diaminopimelate decarboxylase [Parasulfuritortus cantonensis]TCJ11960.1 diaminopimelate decarboxylase [Parasulfuritortus cantonensis]
MTPFNRRAGLLHCEDVALDAIARDFGTPTYVYSSAGLSAAYQAYDQAFAGHEHLICYAVKANSSLAILNLFAKLGAGFDIVSGGELARVLAAGGDPAKVVFSGVGKTAAEMEAALAAGIHCFNVESESELARLNAVAGRLGKVAPVSFRVNPNVDAKTHPYIATGLKENKFGIAYDDAPRLYREAAGLANLRVVGIDCHIGSQLTESSPFGEALDKVLDLVDRLAADGVVLAHIDLGGGLGVRYKDETPPAMSEYAGVLLSRLAGRTQKLVLEPGRSLVANAGLLLTKVEYLKHGEAKDFAIVDAAMNDLMRPSLYDAWHDVQPVRERSAIARRYEIVGPVCESGDFLARERDLALAEGDLLALLSAGAYGMSMSSNYNTRPRAAEVLVAGGNAVLTRRRERVEDLFSDEIVPA